MDPLAAAATRVPTGEGFNGNYLCRTVVFLVAWVLVCMGIDGGFSPYQGGCIVDKDSSADNLFPMILIGGAWRQEE